MFAAALTSAESLAPAQSTLFDFDNAPIHTSLPIDLTVGGVTAHLSATGQGYSIQPANTLGFTPMGFAGLCIYPNSINLADLLVGFSRTITDFSILYSPQELGCDDSARMRVTAYMNGSLVGAATTTAQFPGTWPSQTLRIQLPQGFNSVVVHYDARPPTCQDYGVIFLADNMRVTPAPVSCPGDTNGDLVVNFVDLNQVLSDFGQTAPGLPGDVNNDGTVNFTDLNIVLGVFGVTC